MAIAVGSKVKCIDAANFDKTYTDVVVPVLNQTYTVRQIITNPDVAGDCFRLQEITNPVHAYKSGSGEAAFKAARFQEVVPLATGLHVRVSCQ